MPVNPPSAVPFEWIFSKPFGLADYDKVSEIIDFKCLGPPQPHLRRVPVDRLGQRPAVLTHLGGYDHIPAPAVYSLQGVAMYHSLVFSPSAGGVLPDSLRFGQAPLTAVNGLYLQGRFNPRPAGKGLFSYGSQAPAGGSAVHYDEPVLPFYTLHQFGHYLVEALPMLWYAQRLGRPKLLISPLAEQVPDYLVELAAVFGYGRADFIIPAELATFSALYLPRRLYMEGHYLAPQARQIFARIAAAAGPPADRTPRKIYVSRQHVAERPLINEAECAAFFAERGFAVIHPEGLPLVEQIRLFAGATHLAGPAGSALHLALFSARPRDLKILHLMPEGFGAAAAFYQIESDCGRRPTFVFGRFTDPVSNEPLVAGTFNTCRAPWRLEMSELAAAWAQWAD